LAVAADYPPIPAGVQSNAQGVPPDAQLSKTRQTANPHVSVIGADEFELAQISG
jgi:hypothetical protein